MSRRNTLPGWMVVLLLAAPAALQAGDVDQPNVILILADDLGYGDLACYGAQDIRTPNLDRMASEGTRFADYSVVAPLCTPSRAALITGRYPGRVGLATGVLRPDAKNGLAADETTLAEVVKSRGYVTGCIGKWHLGFLPGMRPLEQGFDSYFGVLHNLDRFETEHFQKEGGMPVLRGDTVVSRPADPAKMTGLYTHEALQFIESHREEPFFLYLSHAMPHLPFDASPEFKGKSARGLYGDVVEELDGSVGQILDRLCQMGLSQRTLVLFTSDNGPERNTPGSAAPLRGTKHTVYEGGLRVPFLAWWPGRVPAGRVCNDFITALDVLPTIARLTGSPLPSERLDGYDLSSVWLGENDAHSPRDTLYAFYGLNKNRRESIRSGHWKLHFAEPPQLYNLQVDIGEAHDLAPQHSEIVERLRRVAEEIRSETGIPAGTK